LNDTTIEVTGVIPVGENTMYVSFKKNLESDMELTNTNVVLAAFTTAWGRMELYKYLDFLGDRCLYLDTDSIIFLTSTGMLNPDKGNFLGDLTCEVEPMGGVGSYITEFCSAGPKNYGYLIKCADGRTKSICKARGITINAGNQDVVNFNTLKNMVLGERGPVSVTYPHKIVRNKKFEVFSTRRCITYQIPEVKKRWIVPGTFNTLPYGYKA
jgi:hypothetical protein